MELKEGYLFKHFKGSSLDDKNIYRIIKINARIKDLEGITYTGEAELTDNLELVIYQNIFQENKYFARTKEELTQRLSDDKIALYHQTYRIEPLTESELEYINKKLKAI